MKSTVRIALSLVVFLVLWSCGPKPTPGETDRQHAQDALDKMK